MTDKELFDILNMKDATYKPITPDILKHLPETYNGHTLCCYEKNGDKFIIYYSFQYGEMCKGPGMYSSSNTWEVLAREIKLCFHITKRKTNKTVIQL